MSGNGPLADQDGSIYLQTANGDFDSAHNHFGNGLLHMRFDGSKMQVVDFFAPCATPFMNTKDLDLGSAAPLFLPGNLILCGGKPGIIYLMDRAHLGGFKPGASAVCQDGNLVTQRIQITMGHIHGTPIFWNDANAAWVYVMGEGDNLKAIPFRNGRLQTAPGDIKMSAWRPATEIAEDVQHQVGRSRGEDTD
jgi:hypothetical protein